MSVHDTDLMTPGSVPEWPTGEIQPSEVQNAQLRKGLALWRAARGTRLFPSREQMSPRALGALLRNTVLVKVLDGGAEFQIRVVGDAIMAVQDVPVQGETTAGIDKLLPGYGLLLHRFYTRALAARIPIALRGPLQRKTRLRSLHREYLLLPLGETDAAVDHFISLVVYMRSPA